MSSLITDVKGFWSEKSIERYEMAMELLIIHIKKIDSELFEKNGRHFIRHIEKRRKSPDSIEEKLVRKGKNNEKNIESIINDLAGIRVVCFDNRQVYRLVEEIKKLDQFIICKIKDYILHTKENGY